MTPDTTDRPRSEDRLDPGRDHRRLAIYAIGLLAVYVSAVAAFWPAGDDDPDEIVFLFIMLAPTVGALLARRFGPGVIRWGRPNVWIVAGLLPTLAVLGVYLLGAAVGVDTEDPAVLDDALTGAWASILAASISALGEEIGWRGFLWPLLRSRHGYVRSALVTGTIWWLYHVPIVLLGWYGSVSGLPAFTVAIIGFTFVVGAITDRARSLWPSVVAHGAWNALVATSFAATEGDESVPAFSGSDALMGEFGWLAAGTLAVLGAATAWYHVRHLAAQVARGTAPAGG